MAKKNFSSIKSVLRDFNFTQKKYISREWQDYGCRLAEAMDDSNHKSLYIKLAKTIDRQILEKARCFVKDANHVRSKPKLFMWKVKQLRDELKKNQK